MKAVLVQMKEPVLIESMVLFVSVMMVTLESYVTMVWLSWYIFLVNAFALHILFNTFYGIEIFGIIFERRKQSKKINGFGWIMHTKGKSSSDFSFYGHKDLTHSNKCTSLQAL